METAVPLQVLSAAAGACLGSCLCAASARPLSWTCLQVPPAPAGWSRGGALVLGNSLEPLHPFGKFCAVSSALE